MGGHLCGVFGLGFVLSVSLCGVESTLADDLKINDRVEQVGRATAAETARPGPTAAGITDTSCIEFTEDSFGATGVVASRSDTNPTGVTALRVAERVEFFNTGAITQLRWLGYYRALTGGVFGECDAFPPDAFTVRILGDNGGLPDDDNVLFEISQATNPGVFSVMDSPLVNTPIGFRPVREHTLTFNPPLAIDSIDPIYVEIVNSTEPGTCFWWYRSGPPGDGFSWSDDFTDWDDGDENDFDFAYCFSFSPDEPMAFPPTADFFLADVSDPETGCCNFGFEVRNRNSPGTGALTEFYVAVHKGPGAGNCEDISDISPPPLWDVEFCDAWDNGYVVYRFTGGFLAEQDTTLGRIRVDRNGEEVVLDDLNTVPANGIIGWASSDTVSGGALCGTGQFGPLAGQSGEWGDGDGSVCFVEPIPALGGFGQIGLLVLICVGGVLALRAGSSRFGVVNEG